MNNEVPSRDSDNRPQHGLEIVDLTSRIAEHHYGSVMLLGNFDGLHRGHQSLVDAGRDLAQHLNAPLGIMSCEPHPRQFLKPSTPPFRLTTRAGKHLTFAALGFRLLFEPRFDLTLATMSSGDFAEAVLRDFLGVRAVIVGRDFRFGHQRSGGVADLTRFGHELGFEVIVMPDLTVENERLSSSRIRGWLNEGHLRKVSDSFAARWMTSITLDEDGIARFEAYQCLPPAGIYQVEVVDANGGFLSREILELHGGRCGQLSSGRLPSLGKHYISGWSAIDAF